MWSGTRCIDVPECMLGLCKGNSKCVNTPTNYTCTCPAGYEYAGYGCVEINECVRANPCKGISVCVDAPVWPICSCPPGYWYNGSNCTDINECNNAPGPCLGGAVCQNTIGSYRCNCPTKPTWAYDNIRGDCYDPCSPNPCGAGGTCTGTPLATTSWKYNCTCPAGTSFVGGSCKAPNLAWNASESCSSSQSFSPCSNVKDGILNSVWASAVPWSGGMEDLYPRVSLTWGYTTPLPSVSRVVVRYTAGATGSLTQNCTLSLSNGGPGSQVVRFMPEPTGMSGIVGNYNRTYSPPLNNIVQMMLTCTKAFASAVWMVNELEVYA
ncbi:hypothetical protein HYH03_013880 [Edaphochlamys debaryana]|uniref:EGF-like domain-containing protein n=1 Tax=Edaphochlamys debaryana TaxID=47281 RepID=A0A835XM93_9CHLO|nr:hypothetical protein HYH03_013880 [Edaphochlamys debaryana]|eukprot:KAG2487457.1 hypothetical protein HYH03_013880 [Edaphochlamys debaryana]